MYNNFRHTPDTGQKLSSEHLAVLDASAVDLALLQECPARSSRGGDDLRGLPFSQRARERGPGILFTFPHPDGTTSNLFRPDDPGDDAPKYWQESIGLGGAGNRLGVHPLQRHLYGRVEVPVLFVEGWKKLLAVVSDLLARGQLGALLVVCLNGTWNWVRKGKVPISDLLALPVSGREATVWYDSDLSLKWQVEQACDEFSEHLHSRGAEVSVVISPPLPNGKKRGADDHLVSGGTLREAMEDWSKRWTPETFDAANRPQRVPGLAQAIAEAKRVIFDRPRSGRGDPAEHKVLRELVGLAAERGRPTPEGLRIDVACRHLTELIAASSRTLYRAVGRLVDAGVLSKVPQKKGRRSGGFIIRARVRHYEEGSRLRDESNDFNEALSTGVLPSRTPSLMESSPGFKPSKKRIMEARLTGKSLPPAREPVKRLGARAGQALDAHHACEGAEPEYTPTDAQIASALGIKRVRDYVRRVKPRMVEAGLITEDGHLVDGWIARVEEMRESGGEITARELVAKRHERERERFRNRRTGEHEGPSDAGIQNILRSRKKRWEHLKNPPPQPKPMTYEESRVRNLVRQGVSERWARAEVYRKEGA